MRWGGADMRVCEISILHIMPAPQKSRLWTPLHHVEQLDLHRLKRLLRAGANLHAKPAPGVPSPLERAQDLSQTEAGQTVLLAAQPWSPANHHLFPDQARAHAWGSKNSSKPR